jgi:hypothetical protein
MGFLGDSVLVYRTWVVNSRNWHFIALPCLLVLGSFVSGWGIVYTVGAAETGVYLDPTVIPFTDAFLACSITVNILCTGMIAWRILSVAQRSTVLSLVTRVVVESALLCTLTSILSFILNTVGSAAVYVVADAVRILTSSRTPQRANLPAVFADHSAVLQSHHYPHVQHTRELRRGDDRTSHTTNGCSLSTTAIHDHWNRLTPLTRGLQSGP